MYAIANHNDLMYQLSSLISMLVVDDELTKSNVVAALSDIVRDMASGIPYLPSKEELVVASGNFRVNVV